LSLAGKLGEVTPTELLQFIAYNRKTGKLTLTRRDGHGVIVFRAGRIIYAATHSMRETFGNILIRRGLIDEATLLLALDRHSQPSEERRLGAILIEMGKVQREDLEEVMRQQTGVVLAELLPWNSGFFKFEPMQVSDRGEIQVDAMDFVVAEGVSAEHVMLEIATKLDAQAPYASFPDGGAEASASPSPDAAAVSEAPPSLRAIITDLQSPALRAEITLAIMRYAAQVVERGVLLVVRSGRAVTNGHFGIERPAAGTNPAIGEIELPLNAPSVFAEVAERRQSFKGKLSADPVNSRFLRCLGYPPPQESVVVPMLVDDRVAMLLYGDNGASDAPIGPVEALERVMAESGLAMEKMALEAKLKHVGSTRRRP
jgi:hypothetical protein